MPIFKHQRNFLNKLMFVAKNEYFRDLIKQNNHDQRKLFSIVKSLLGTDHDQPLPTCESNRQLANNFASYFVNKVMKIRSELDTNSISSSGPYNLEEPSSTASLRSFELCSEEHVYHLIGSSTVKSSELDPIPAHLFKSYLGEIVPVITKIINMSLEQGKFPKLWKEAVVNHC